MHPLTHYPTFIRFLLLILRFFLRMIRDFDGFFSSIISKVYPKPYSITGKCKKRGICCRNIGIQLSDGLWEYTYYKSFVRRWYEFVYNFEYIGSDNDDQFLLFKCRYLKDNMCSIHKRRPYICRNYPLQRYFKQPKLIPGCGYRVKQKIN